jgi:peptide deformylase
MAIQKIMTVPSPILRQKSKPVNPPIGGDQKIKNLVNDLLETVKAAKEPRGVGLSAVQINKLIRIFVVKRGENFTPFINPKIIWQSKKRFSQVLAKEKLFMEGCLSVPGYYGFVDRSYAIKLQWQDLQGKTNQEKFEDRESAYVQHELDHLDGVLFVDRILEQKGKIYQLEKNEKDEETLVEVEIG